MLHTFWAKLEDAIHPEDISAFKNIGKSGFNLDYPPPAFVGDVVNSPIIIIDNNGGYNPQTTPREFEMPDAASAFRNALASPRRLNPKDSWVSPYYLQRNFSKWLVSGLAALVNGVAYRSVDGHAENVSRLTSTLPSARLHRIWVENELIPQVEEGTRLVVVHRWSRWLNTFDKHRSKHGIVFSPAPVSKDLTRAEIEAIEKFMKGRGL